mgnify:CR=1
MKRQSKECQRILVEESDIFNVISGHGCFIVRLKPLFLLTFCCVVFYVNVRFPMC